MKDFQTDRQFFTSHQRQMIVHSLMCSVRSGNEYVLCTLFFLSASFHIPLFAFSFSLLYFFCMFLKPHF